MELLVAQNRVLGSTLVLVTRDAALAAHADRTVTVRAGTSRANRSRARSRLARVVYPISDL